jgi:predicted GNAT family acetyltransferase
VLQSIAPGTRIESDVLFATLENKVAQKLYFKVGIIGVAEVKVIISP